MLVNFEFMVTLKEQSNQKASFFLLLFYFLSTLEDDDAECVFCVSVSSFFSSDAITASHVVKYSCSKS